MTKPMVTICCLTYNHERYIADALEGFLAQRTDFTYEILIHDDASTDKTVQIIEEYVVNNPGKFVTIYQQENQYSKGIRVSGLLFKKATGKYIAWCEGDDYWIDANKLQSQVEYLENHLESSLCVHAVYRVDGNKRKKRCHVRPSIGNKSFTVDDVIRIGGGGFGTNSMVFRSDLCREMPSYYDMAPVADYPLTIHLATQGKVHYIDSFMSAYRVNIEGSWTSRNLSSTEKFAAHYKRIATMLRDIDVYTGGKHRDAILDRIAMDELEVLIQQRRYRDARSGAYKDAYKTLSTKKRLGVLVDMYCPIAFRAYMAIAGRR